MYKVLSCLNCSVKAIQHQRLTKLMTFLSAGAGLASNLRKVIKLMHRLGLPDHAGFFRTFLERAELDGSLIGDLLRSNKLIKCDWQAVSLIGSGHPQISG